MVILPIINGAGQFMATILIGPDALSPTRNQRSALAFVDDAEVLLHKALSALGDNPQTVEAAHALATCAVAVAMLANAHALLARVE